MTARHACRANQKKKGTAMKKFLPLLLCLCLLVLPLAGCGRGQPVVMEYRGLGLDLDVYRYWLSCYRAQFAYEETEENRERLALLADVGIQKTLVAAALFDSYGLELGETGRAVLDAAMERLVETAGGSRAALDQAGAAYGIGYDGLRLAIAYEQKAASLYSYLFGEGGAYALTEAELEAHYQETYAHVQMIYVSYVAFETNEDGDRIWDDALGHYRYTPLSGQALADKQAKVQAVRDALQADRSEAAFAALIKSHNEDPAAEEYPGGFYFSSEEDYSAYLPGVTGAALQLAPGAVAEVRTEYGVHFLLGLEKEEGAYQQAAHADFFVGFRDRLSRRLYEDFLTEQLREVTIYAAVKDTVSYATAEPNFDLYW